MFESLRNQILGGPESRSALARHLVFHETYKRGGILDDFYSEYGDDPRVGFQERDSYIERRLSQDFSGDISEKVGERVLHNVMQSEVDRESSIGQSGVYRVKSIISSFANEVRANSDPGSDIDNFVGNSLFKNLFGNQRDSIYGHYQAMDLSTPNTGIDELKRNLLIQSGAQYNHDDVSYYMRGTGRDPNARRMSGAFGYSLDNRLEATNRVDRTVYNTRYELARLKGKAYGDYTPQDAVDYLHTLIDGRAGYINKPGISPVVSIVESSDSVLDLDMFQFQNEHIGDMFYNKIVEKAAGITGTAKDGSNFRVRVRIAQSDEGSVGETGHNILGPNIIQLQRLASLRDKMIRTLTENLIIEGVERSEAESIAFNRVHSNFQVVQSSRKNHRKLLINDQIAIIGSANFTQPLGSSLYQEGSTYEAVRVLTKMDSFEELFGESLTKEQKLIKRAEVSYALEREASRKAFIEYGRGPKFGSKFLEYKNKALQDFNHQVVSSKLYMQTRRVNDMIHGSPATKFMVSGERNIGLSHDIWIHMSRTLRYAEEDTTTKLKMMLDQPFVLHFGNEIYSGEMGHDLSLGSGSRESQYRKHIQDRLYRLLSSDRAEVVVDIRNYRDRILDPTYAAVRKVLGSLDGTTGNDVLNRDYENNLERLVSLSDSFEVRRQKLTELFGRSSYEFQPKDQFSSMDQLVKQVLVITSGNVRLTTQPKQHLKSYGLFNTVGNLISYYMGSSNMGPGSLAMNRGASEADIANEELGLLLGISDIHKRNTSKSEWDLNVQDETSDLMNSTLNFNRQWNTLTGASVRQDTSTRPSWERNVDTRGVETLAANLRQVNEALGFEAIKLSYMMGGSTGSKRVGVHVQFNMGALTGVSNAPNIRYKFAPLRYSSGDDRGGFVYVVDQAKAVGRARFVNSTTRESIKMPFGIGEKGRIEAQASSTLNAVQNVSVRMATLAGEIANKSLVSMPKAYLTSMYGNDFLSNTFIDYLEWLGTGKSQGGDWLLNAEPSEITKLASELQTRLGSSTNGLLTKVRDFTNTNRAEVNAARTEQLIYVTSVLESFKSASTDDRYLLLADIFNSWRSQNSSIWQDLMLDVVTSHNDYGYENFVRDSIRATGKYIFEDAVTQGKQSAYTGPQGYGKLALLGVSDSAQYQNFISLASEVDSSSTGFNRIFDFARFVPLTYGPTTNLHTSGAFRSVAEGGGSRPGDETWSGLTMFGMNKQELGNIVDIEIMNSMGVGFTTTRSEVESYLSTIEGVNETLAQTLADKIYSGNNPEAKLVTYLFSPKKISQIPQRLKNVMGSQAMHVIDPYVSSLMEQKDGSLPSYLEAETDKFRWQVARVLQTASLSPISDKQAYERAKSVVDDGYVNSLVIGSDIRKVLSFEAQQIIEAEKASIEKELGIENLEDMSLGGADKVVQQLLRSRLINRDLASPGVKGFTGPKGDQITLVQLGGAHTDYFFANPVYGGEFGARQGFIDRQEKRLKASMLSNDWTDSSNTKILAWSGDYVSFDKDKGRVIVVHSNSSEKPGKISSYSIDMFTSADLPSEYVDSMGTRSIFKDIADNTKGVSGESSFATYKGAAWFSEGEDSIEYTLGSKWLTSDPEGNQSVFELTLLRTKKAGGGARFEAFGSLFKAVSYFTTKDTIQHVLDKMMSSSKQDGASHSFDQGIDIHKVLGIGGPAHLKSYSFEHGANILMDEKKLSKTLSHTNQQMAMGLLLGFGPAFLENQPSVSKANLRSIKQLVYGQAVSGALGSYYKELAIRATLQADFNKSLEKAAKDYIAEAGLGPSVLPSTLLENRDSRLALTAEVVANDLMNKASFSTITTPDLLGINGQDIMDALRGRGQLKSKVSNLLRNQASKARARGFFVYKDFTERSAINITTALDINAQLSSQGDMRGMPTDVDLRDNRVLMQMASIAGGYDLGRMTIDEDYSREVEANLRGQLSSYKVLAFYTSINFSQSKVAMSKKFEANLEYQYMLKSFPANFRMLRGGGKLEHIKRAVSTIHKATSMSEEVLVSDIEQNMGDLNIRPFHSLEFASYGTKETLGKARFLSIYGGTSNISQISMYRKKLMELSLEKREKINTLMGEIQRAEHERREIVAATQNNDEDRLVQMANWKSRYTGMYDELVSLMVNNGDSIEGTVLEHQFKSMARTLEADSEKGFGTGQAKDFLDAMEAAGQKAFMFSLPSISGVEYTGDGKVKLKYSYDNPISVFMPDASILKNLGVEFGSYIADELKATMLLTTGFAPGTTMSLIRDQMAVSELRGKSEIIIAQEDLAKVQKYWATASAMTEMLALSSSGTISKRAFAGENRMPGVVSFAAASFLVPKDTAVVAQAALERHGLNVNPSRERAIKSLNATLQSVNKSRTILSEKRSQGLNVNERLSAKANTMARNLYLQNTGLARGASPEATSMLTSVRNESIYMRQQMQQLERMKTQDLASYRATLSTLIERNKKLSKSIKDHKFRDKGDFYVDKVARNEALYWKKQLEILSIETFREDEPSKDRAIKQRRRLLKELEGAPWLVEGLSIGSRFKVGRNTSRIAVEDLENSLRGRAGVTSWDDDHWKSITSGDVDLTKKEKDSLFLHMLEKRASKYTQLAEAYEHQYGIHLASSEVGKKGSAIDNRNAYQDLKSLGRKMSGLARDFKEGKVTYEDAVPKLNRLLARLETSDLAQAFINRSSPSGGTEHQRQLFGILRSIDYINEKASSFNKEGSPDTYLLGTDRGRNSTLTLLSPLSQVTMSLGDFDGDPYTIIFSGLADMANSIEKIEDKRKGIEIKLGALYRKHAEASNSKLAAMATGDQVAISNAGKEEAAYQAVIDDLLETDARLDNKRKSYILKSEMAKDMMDPNVYDKAIRKEVANYMGLNAGMFTMNTSIKDDDGGLFALFDMSVDVLPSFIEQGSGLFGGMEDQGSNITKLNSLFERIILIDPISPNQEFVQIRRDRTAINEAISALAAEDGPDKTFYTTLNIMGDLKAHLWSEIESQFINGVPINEAGMAVDDYRRAMSTMSNSIYQSVAGLKEAQAKVGQGAGITMEYSTYDFLTNVLGKAGGDLLGKTYNTLIGTLYADSPLLALSHIFNGEGSTRDNLRESVRGSLGEDGDIFLSHLSESAEAAAATQGFMKNIHQLLRDSIKFKSEGGDLKSDLERMAKQYDGASVEEKERLINQIAATLGPGPGLSALMNLNTLVVEKDRIQAGGADIGEYVTSTFGLAGFVDNASVDAFTAVKREYAALTGKQERDVSALDVVYYKVSEDIKSLVSAFRYEKEIGGPNSSSKADRIMSYGQLERNALFGIRQEGGDLYNWLRGLEIISSDDNVDGKKLLASMDEEFGGSNLRSILDDRISSDIDNWYAGLSTNKKRRVHVISEGQYDDLNVSQKAILRSMMEEEDHQTVKWLGQYGEGLNRFTTLSQVRMDLTGFMSGSGGSNLTSSFQEADLAMTMLNLATQDKLSAKAQSMFFAEMVRSAGLSVAPPSKSDPRYEGNEELYRQDREQYDNDLRVKILKRVSGIPLSGEEGEGASSLMYGLKEGEKEAFTKALDKFLGTEISVDIPGQGPVTYSTGMDFISHHLEDTAAGQRSSMVRSIIEANSSVYMGAKDGRTDVLALAQSFLDDPNDGQAMYQIVQQLGALGLGGEHPASGLLAKKRHLMSQYDSILKRDYALVERETAKAQRSSNILDIIGPLALTLIGGAVLEGGITEDMLGQAAGASLMTLAYSKQGIVKRGGWSVFGGGFRLTNAIAQANGDVDEGMANYVKQELAFSFGAMAVAPGVETLVNRTVARSIDPNIKYRDAVKASMNPLAYKLKQGTVLDVDRFTSTKAVSGSVSSALLSAVIGMTMAGVVGEMVAAPQKVRTDSAIDLAIQSLADTVKRSTNYKLEAELQRDVITVTNEEGTEYMDHERDVNELIYESSIDYISDINYVQGIPQFIMVGVSTEEDYS